MKRWLYVVQQRLAITNTEATALVAVSFLFFVGLVAGEVRSRLPVYSDATYATADRLFREGAVTATAGFVAILPDSARASPDTTRTSDSTLDDSQSGRAPVRLSAPVRAQSTYLIDINTAAAHELERLPRIGPALAERIVAYRAEFGPFRTNADLMNVRGIGKATFERLRDMLKPINESDSESE